jgi:hypothetical protein
LAACLAQFIALGGGAFDLGTDGIKSVVAAGLAAIVPVVIRWLNPKDKSFGTGA